MSSTSNSNSNIPQTGVRDEHYHTMSNPDSGYTDFELDSRGRKHRHKLSTGCRTCDKARRRTVYAGSWGTTFSHAHYHPYEPGDIEKYLGRKPR